MKRVIELGKKYNNLISKFVKEKLYFNTYMCLTDNTHMEIENCKRILDYTDGYIRIKTATLIICIYGENMNISDYNTDGIIISGKINNIEFE